MKEQYYQLREMDDSSSPKKRRDYVKSKDTRLHWNPELHRAFLLAIEKIGGLEKATPKFIAHVMDVEGVTITHVKSHLQMYRGSLKKDSKKKEGRKRSRKNNGGNFNRLHDESLHSASNPMNESQTRPPRRTRTLRRVLNRVPMEPLPICNALEYNRGVMGGGISMQQRDPMETAPQLKSLLIEEESNINKEDRTDDRHLTSTGIPTPEAMEEIQEPNYCSLSLSLSLPEQRNILASRNSSTSSASSLKHSNVHDKSDSEVNLDLSISM